MASMGLLTASVEASWLLPASMSLRWVSMTTSLAGVMEADSSGILACVGIYHIKASSHEAQVILLGKGDNESVASRLGDLLERRRRWDAPALLKPHHVGLRGL